MTRPTPPGICPFRPGDRVAVRPGYFSPWPPLPVVRWCGRGLDGTDWWVLAAGSDTHMPANKLRRRK